MTFEPLLVDLALVAGILLVFTADLLLPPDGKRGLGALAALSVTAVLAASFVVDATGSAFGGHYVNDAFALYLKRAFLAAGALALLGSIDSADRRFPARQGEYYLLVMFSLLGMTLLAGARELILLIVSFELMSLPLVMLAAFEKKGDGPAEAAIKLYLVAAASTAITLYGMSLIYGLTGSTEIAVIAATAFGGDDPLLALGILALLAGLGFKLGVVPFHMWVPDTYQGAPTAFVAFLSTAPKIAGFAAMIHLFVEGLLPWYAHWQPMVFAVAVLSLVLGNLFAIRQDNAKRLLAFSGVAHVGLMLAALAFGTVEGLGMLLFYLVAYLFTNVGAFAVQAVVGGAGGTDDIRAYAGLAQRSPALAMAMLIFLLSLGGIPFVAGFWAKIYLFVAAWDAGLRWFVLLGASLAVLSLFYYLRIARAMYMDPPPDEAPPIRVGVPTLVALIVAAVGVVGMGVMPGRFLDAALAAAAAIVGG